MRFIRGHNSRGMDRSKPWKIDRYRVEDRGHATPCWVWQMKTTNAGYGFVKSGERGQVAHRWYYEQAKGPIPEGMQLDHLCSVRLCVNPDHLEPVTPMENTRRSRAMKLTYGQAVEIHRRRVAGETIRSLASEFEVSKETVRLIGISGPDQVRRQAA